MTTNEEQDEATLDASAPGNTPPPPKPSKLRERLRRENSPTVPTLDNTKNPFGEPIGQKAAAIPDDVDPDVLGSQTEPVDDRLPDEPRSKFERLGLTKATKALREEEDKNLVDWLRSLESEAPIRVMLRRKEPKEFIDPRDGERKNVGGHLKTYDRPIDEAEIQAKHGGGLYNLVVQKREPHGNSYRIVAHRTLEVAGDPRFDDVPRTVKPMGANGQPGIPQQSTGPTMESQVMGKMVDHLLANRNQPIQMPDVSGAVQAAVQPFIESQRRLEQQLERKDAELSRSRQGNPEESQFRERLLEKFIDQDSARLQAIRAQYESEIRTIKEIAINNENRLRDSFERDKESLNRQHEREIGNLKSANDLKIAALEQSFQVQKTVIESDNRRLERELTELRQDVKELRNKKEPSFKDQLAGIRDMKDMIGDVMGDDDDKEEKSTVVKILEGAAQSPIIAGAMEKIMGGAAGMAPPPEMAQRAMPAAPAPRRRGPKLIRDRRNGQVYATDGVKAIPVKRKPPIEAPQQQPPQPQVMVDEQGNQVVVQPEPPPMPEAVSEQPTEVPIPYIAPEHVALATDYMTKAFGNNINPADFVTGVQMFIPKEVVQALGQLGPEDFLRRVGGLPDDHPLLQQSGRNWVRKVSKLLVGE